MSETFVAAVTAFEPPGPDPGEWLVPGLIERPDEYIPVNWFDRPFLESVTLAASSNPAEGTEDAFFPGRSIGSVLGDIFL